MATLIWRALLLATVASLVMACAPAAPTVVPTKAPAPTAATPTIAVAKPAAKPGFMRPPEPNPKRGGTLRTAWSATTAHFDVHQGGSGPVLSHLYNNLVYKNLADGLRTIVPDLAERWETSPDGKTYTFYLRDKIKFHDGTEFNSADVVATFRRIVFPPEGVASIFKTELEVVDKIEAVDRLTVRFTLKHPWAPFLEVLTGRDIVVYPKKALDENNQDLRKIVAPGTGAFVFKEHKVAERWILERNPNYWDPELPYVDRLELLHIGAWVDRGTAVLTGQADISWNVSVETWQEGKKRGDMGTAQLPCLNSHNMIINNQKKPFDDPRVRKAIHLAVSRQDVIKAFETVWEPAFVTRWMPLTAPYATPQEEFLKMPGYRADKTADIATAKKLLADAGHPNGFDNVDLVAWTDPASSQVAVPAFQDQMKRALNIGSKIRVIERGLTTEVLKGGTFDIFKADVFESPTLDPTPMWNSHLKTGGSRNWSRYSNPALDKLLDPINIELDENKRKQLFKEGMDLLDENPPMYLIGFCAHSPMWRSYVKGLAIEKRVHTFWGRMETVWLDK